MTEDNLKVAEEAVKEKEIGKTEPIEDQEKINWRKFRDQRDIDRKKAEESAIKLAEKEKEAAALKSAMESLLNRQANQSQDPYEEEDDIQKRVDKAMQTERAKYDQEQKEREQTEYPIRLTQTHSDFNDVCSTENLDYLEYHHPEISRAFASAPDSFQKWSDVYKTVKKLVPNSNSRKDEKRANENFTRPQSMSVGGVTQTSDHAPHMLNDSKRQANWARMNRVIKGIN